MRIILNENELTREVAAELAAKLVEVRVAEVTVGPIHDVPEALEPGVVATRAKVCRLSRTEAVRWKPETCGLLPDLSL